MSSRHFKPEIRVSSLRFSPTGRSWAATTTEGLLVYSLDGSLVFDPYDLDLDVTPASIRKQLRLQDWASAIVLAFRLNENALKQEVLEAVPHEQSRCEADICRVRSLEMCLNRIARLCSSPGGLWISTRRLRGEAAGLCGYLLGEVEPPAVLHDLGPEPAHAAWPET